MRKFLESLLALWHSLEGRLTQIEDNELVKRYGQKVRQSQRLEAIAVWRDETSALIAKFKGETLPLLRAKDAENVLAGLANLASGRPADSGYRADGSKIPGTPAPADPMLAKLDALSFQAVVSNAIALTQMQGTENLQDVLNNRLEEAERGEEFAYLAWRVERLVYATLLRGRAAAGDHRAGLALDLIPKIERALIGRSFPAQGEIGYELEKIEEVTTGAIVGSGEGARENLGPAQAWYGLVQRSFDRQREYPDGATKLETPKPKAEVDQDVLNRIALGRQPAAEISKLWS